MPSLSGRWRSAALDAACAIGIAAAGFWALGFLLGDDLFIFADNPGTFFRIWWLLEDAPRNGQGLFGWSPWWWAGWPEWLFYPPGYGIAAAGLKVVSAGALSTIGIYQLLLVLSYALPAVSAFVGLRLVGANRVASVAAAVALLTFTDLYGGVGGVMIGMLGDRPALGLAPLAWGLLGRGMRSPRPAVWIAAAGAVLGASILLHPFRYPFPLLLAALLMAFDPALRARFWRNSGLLAVAGALAVGLAAFWLVPYAAVSGAQVAVLRAPLETLGFWLFGGRLPLFAAVAAIALALGHTLGGRSSAAVWAIAAAGLLTLAWMVFDWVVLVGGLGTATLDPIRFIEDVYLAVMLLFGFGVAGLVQFAAAAPTRSARLGGAAGAALALFLAVQPFPAWLTYYQRQPGAEPRFLKDAVRDYRLDRLWETLRANPGGRVLFTSSVFRMRQTGTQLPTYLFSLSPMFTGRAAVGGGFQHWSPVSAFYWYGENRPRIMADRTDLKDDQEVFGLRWREMDEPALLRHLEALDITDVVATDFDVWARTYLDRSPAFRAVANDPQWVVYRVVSPSGSQRVRMDGDAAISQSGDIGTSPSLGNAGTWSLGGGGSTRPNGLLRLPSATVAIARIEHTTGSAGAIGGGLSVLTALLAVALAASGLRRPRG